MSTVWRASALRKFWRHDAFGEKLCRRSVQLQAIRPFKRVQAGLKAIYCSGWQVAGDGNSAGEMYPDQSLYPVDSVPKMVERINNALLRTDQIHHLDGR